MGVRWGELGGSPGGSQPGWVLGAGAVRPNIPPGTRQTPPTIPTCRGVRTCVRPCVCVRACVRAPKGTSGSRVRLHLVLSECHNVIS